MCRSWPRPVQFLRWAGLSGILIIVLSGCASQPDWPPSFSTSTRTEVPFHPQEQYQCGPASLAMMLNAQKVAVSPDELVERVYLPERKGALQVEMVAAARQYGMLVYPLERNLQSILAEVQAGNPVLVLQNLRFGWWPQWHFAVVKGYDSANRVLILHSGTEENYRQPVSAFMATWNRSERWARTILPPGEIPATARPIPFLLAAHDLETTRQLQAARAAYQAARQTWPDQPAALLGLGNLAYKQGQWSNAEGYYRTMTRAFPHIDAGWRNLAEALYKQGKEKEADAVLNEAGTADTIKENSGPND